MRQSHEREILPAKKVIEKTNVMGNWAEKVDSPGLERNMPLAEPIVFREFHFKFR